MLRLISFSCVLTLSLLLCSTSPGAAQSLSSGSAGGLILGSDGEPVSGVTVSLIDESSGTTRSAVTPRDGYFVFSVVPPGRYILRAEQFGYRPQVIENIVVRAGQRTDIRATLPVVEGAAARTDTLTFGGALLAGSGPGLAVDVGAGLSGFPVEGREVTEIGRYSSLADDDLQMQGLPASMSGVRVDGVPVGVLSSASLLPGSVRAAALPLSMFGRAALVATNPDVEWSGNAGGSLDAFTTSGGRELAAESFGYWSGEALGSDPGQRLQGGLLVGGPLIRDTASFVVGLEAWRLPSPVVLPDSQPADEVTTDVVSAFAQLAWQMSTDTHLDTRASFAFIPSAAGDLLLPRLAGMSDPYSGNDLFVGATLTTRFSDRVYQEVRVGVGATTREYDDVDQLATTRILSSGALLGTAGSRPASFSESTVRASETLHIVWPDHRLKLGLSGSFSAVDSERKGSTEAFFSNLDDYASGEAFRVQSIPTVGGADFTIPNVALFVQDTWTAGMGLDLLLGLRLDAGRLPADDLMLNQEWLDISGLDNTEASPIWWRASPRVGFTWDLQNRHEWMISGSGGIYSGTSDALLLGDWLGGDGGTDVRRGFGTQGAVMHTATVDASTFGTALTILNPGFEPPRTFRANLGISRAIGTRTAVKLAGLYRHTDFLPRTSDLNLLPSPVGADQFGRPVFGELRQRGSLLYAEPGSNRRFAGFDRVTAVDVDGWSTYTGVTASVEHIGESGLSGFASYTFSSTEDNWIPTDGYGAGATLSPVLGEPASDALEGTSSFDVPHRAVAGVELQSNALAGLRTALFYRYRSGTPFTPGFRIGVDANADGSFRNDPAFIDPAIAGTDALLGEWGCLAEYSGGFAARNSCRTDGRHSLDARIALGIAEFGEYRAELVIDGLNILAAERSIPDAALYLLDPTGSLTSDAEGRIVVPLIANENFGRPLGNFGSGRMLRLGFRLSH